MSNREKHLEELKRARAEKDRLIRGDPKIEPIIEVPVPIPEPEPETITTYLPTNEVLEIIDAGLVEEPIIELTPEEKKAIRKQKLEAEIAALEAEE